MTKLAKIMLTALTFGAFGIYLTSCSQSEILENTTENSIEQSSGEFKLSEQGWLHFENDAALDAAKNELFQYMKNDNLDEFEKKYGYKSLHTAYWETMENLTDDQRITMASQRQVSDEYKDIFTFIGEGEDLEAVPTVQNDVTASLLNHRGIYQIGTEIHKYNYDVIKIIKDGDIHKLSLIDGVNSNDLSLNIEVRPNEENLRLYLSEDESNIVMERACSGFGTYTDYSEKKKARRIKGEVKIWDINNNFVLVSEITTKQKQVGAWFATNWNGWARTRSSNLIGWHLPNYVTYNYPFRDTGVKWDTNPVRLSAVDIGAVTQSGPVLYMSFDTQFDGKWYRSGSSGTSRTFAAAESNSSHAVNCW